MKTTTKRDRIVTFREAAGWHWNMASDIDRLGAFDARGRGYRTKAQALNAARAALRELAKSYHVTHHPLNPRNQHTVRGLTRAEAVRELRLTTGVVGECSEMLDAAGNVVAYRDWNKRRVVWIAPVAAGKGAR